MIKANGENVVVSVFDDDVENLLIETSNLIFGVYLILQQKYPHKINRFKELISKSTDKNNFDVISRTFIEKGFKQ